VLTATNLRRFVLRLFAALPVVVLLWAAASPLYNRILAGLGEPLVRLFESPNRTTLYVRGYEQLMITRSDYGGGQGYLAEVRLPDLHFTWILFAALALATPGVEWAERGRRILFGAGLFVIFHLLLLFLRVEAVYATELGDWSLARYGRFAREAIGLAKHVADLPVKLALPFALWWGLFGGDLRGAPRPLR
jgi:hypothetical protein